MSVGGHLNIQQMTESGNTNPIPNGKRCRKTVGYLDLSLNEDKGEGK